MSEVRTRDEALAAIDRGLAQWATSVSGVLIQASAAGSAAASAADCVVRRLTNAVAAAEMRLASMSAEDDRSPLERELAEARRSLEVAMGASRRVEVVLTRVAALQRTDTRHGQVLVEQARSDLARRGGDLGGYRGGGGGGDAAVVSAILLVDCGVSEALAGRGLTVVQVANADLAENPIVGAFGRGDTGRADYRWLVQTWDEVVGPGVGRGMTRDDFVQRDAERGAPPLRRTSDVFDLFLGDANRIRLTRRADGSLEVNNGRHRLAVARELGVASLPAQVIEL